MTGSFYDPSHGALTARLDTLRDLLAAASPEETSELSAVRVELQGAREDAQAEGRRDLAEALARLSQLTEVWECLVREEPDAADVLTAFWEEALGKFMRVETEDEEAEQAEWVRQESSSRWGTYLDLLAEDRPTARPATPTPRPSDDDAPPAIDIGALLQMFGVKPTPAAKPAPPPPAPQRRPESKSEPLDAGSLPGIDIAEMIRRLNGEAPAARPANPPATVPPIASLLAKPKEPPKPTPKALAEPTGPPTDDVEPEDELREIFLADATDIFEKVEGIVLRLDRRSPDGAALQELSRHLHTLKGAAGAVGLHRLAALIHGLDDRIEEGQEGKIGLARVAEHLYDGLAHIEARIASLRRGPEPAAKTPAIHAPTATDEAALESPSAPVLGSEGETSVRVPNERIEELMDVVSELISRRGPWAAQAEKMKDFAATARGCRTRLMATFEQLGGMVREPSQQPARLGTVAPAVDFGVIVRRLGEQIEDLAVMAEAAQAAALPMADDADAMGHLSYQLWESLQSIRVVPVRGLFQRLTRVARDAAKAEGREVEVQTIGVETGLDRAIQERVFEPLLHVVRNAVGHGIEPPDVREAARKPRAGCVTIEARREGNTMVLAVRDDGRGLDDAAIHAKGRRLGLIAEGATPTREELHALIMRAGFSTRDQANSVAGRGVGMDVVAREVGRLRGTITIDSQPGSGTAVMIRLPARLWLEQAMMVRAGAQLFALPTAAIEDTSPFEPAQREGRGPASIVRVRGRRVPLVAIRELLRLAPAGVDDAPRLLLIRPEDESIALLVDAIVGPKELVIKPLSPLLAGHPAISGTSLSASNELIYALDPFGLARHRTNVPTSSASLDPVAPAASRALVVDDSISVRRVAARHLRALGLDVDEAADGLEAMRKLKTRSYRLVLTDLEMPRMDGFELLQELSRTCSATPVVVSSTRTDPATRDRVLGMGARAFVPKPVAAEALAGAIGPLLGVAPSMPSKPG